MDVVRYSVAGARLYGDVIKEVFEDELGPDLISAVPRVPSKMLYNLRDRVREYGHTARVPAKEVFHLRPFVPIDHRIDVQNTERVPAHGFQLRYWRDFKHPDLEGVQTRALTQHLLYCHSVAISNQLALITDLFLPELIHREPETRQ